MMSKTEFQHMCQHIDMKHRSLPPTAQVAKQQGLYLAASLNNEAKGHGAATTPFDFSSQGQMAYVGKNVSVAGFGEDGSFVMAVSESSFLSFPCVCPEPVLAKCSVSYINGLKTVMAVRAARIKTNHRGGCFMLNSRFFHCQETLCTAIGKRACLHV
jgi:hypothetical protein